MIQLHPFESHEYNKEKNYGFMRFDFASGGKLSNSFVAGPEFSQCQDKTLLQKELNEILFEQLSDWEQVGNLVDEMKCLSEFTANDVAFYFAETQKHQFLIRLMPSDISKIFVFGKQ